MTLSEEFYMALNLCLNTRCNICRNDCPEFRAEKLEFNSPRGKLELVLEALEGKITEDAVCEEISCVSKCNECYSSCPHGIHIPDILAEFRESRSEL